MGTMSHFFCFKRAWSSYRSLFLLWHK